MRVPPQCRAHVRTREKRRGREGTGVPSAVRWQRTWRVAMTAAMAPSGVSAVSIACVSFAPTSTMHESRQPQTGPQRVLEGSGGHGPSERCWRTEH